jgi:hypothetical protein
MTIMNEDVLRLRALGRARGRGELVVIGMETRTQQKLVEEGHLWQEIANGQRYRFTLSPSGRRMLDASERREA